MEAPGEKLLLKLWETLAERGIGGLLKPWQIRREAKALADVRRDEMLILAAAEHDANLLRSGSARLAMGEGRPYLLESGEHARPFRGPPQSPAELVSGQMMAKEIQREVNVARAVLHAENALENDPGLPTDAAPSTTWVDRWREAAGNVSDQELQVLWGRLLAGEVASPGAFSLRTMDFIRNLSQREAQLIERLAPFVVSGSVLRGATQILEDADLSFQSLLELQELGVIVGVDAVGLTISYTSRHEDSFLSLLRTGDTGLVVTHADVAKEFSLPVYKVTTLGMELMKLAPAEQPQDYRTYIVDALKKQGFKVELAVLVDVGGNRFGISNRIEL